MITLACMLTIDQIIKHFGGTQQSLAEKLGISREAVSMWDGEIPEGRAFQIQVLSDGKFRVEDMPVKRKEVRRSA